MFYTNINGPPRPTTAAAGVEEVAAIERASPYKHEQLRFRSSWRDVNARDAFRIGRVSGLSSE